jgi:hypothetical protein
VRDDVTEVDDESIREGETVSDGEADAVVWKASSTGSEFLADIPDEEDAVMSDVVPSVGDTVVSQGSDSDYSAVASESSNTDYSVVALETSNRGTKLEEVDASDALMAMADQGGVERRDSELVDMLRSLQ